MPARLSPFNDPPAPVKRTLVKSRVDQGDPALGVIREADLSRIQWVMEKNLARFLKTVIYDRCLTIS